MRTEKSCIRGGVGVRWRGGSGGQETETERKSERGRYGV